MFENEALAEGSKSTGQHQYRKLPGLPEAEKTEANRVHGCQAMVWLVMEPDPDHAGALRIRADSDAFIVRGLLAVLQLIFSGHTPEEILAADAKSTVSQLGLDKHLSPTRKNGLFAMVERIRTLAGATNQPGSVPAT